MRSYRIVLPLQQHQVVQDIIKAKQHNKVRKLPGVEADYNIELCNCLPQVAAPDTLALLEKVIGEVVERRSQQLSNLAIAVTGDVKFNSYIASAFLCINSNQILEKMQQDLRISLQKVGIGSVVPESPPCLILVKQPSKESGPDVFSSRKKAVIRKVYRTLEPRYYQPQLAICVLLQNDVAIRWFSPSAADIYQKLKIIDQRMNTIFTTENPDKKTKQCYLALPALLMQMLSATVKMQTENSDARQDKAIKTQRLISSLCDETLQFLSSAKDERAVGAKILVEIVERKLADRENNMFINKHKSGGWAFLRAVKDLALCLSVVGIYFLYKRGGFLQTATSERVHAFQDECHKVSQRLVTSV